MRQIRFAAVLTVCLGALSMQAQTAAPVPDAPVPVPANSGKLTLTLPATSYSLAANEPVKKKVLVCGGDADGVYTTANQQVPLEKRGEVDSYIRNLAVQTQREWVRNYKKIEKTGWEHTHVVKIRVAIRPDGTYFDPQVAVSSGYKAEDLGALMVVRDVPQFQPLPEGIEHPLVACLQFGYNMRKDEMDRAVGQQWMEDKQKP